MLTHGEEVLFQIFPSISLKKIWQYGTILKMLYLILLNEIGSRPD